MSDFAGKQSQVDPCPAAETMPVSSPRLPGKHTMVEQAQAGAPPVQRKARPAGGSAHGDAIHDAAERGTATAASALPHASTIQQLFGRHDISGIKAHTGGEAAASARDMGADAYASGDHVVLGDRGTDLFTVAHEAAHVVQQRGGVQLKGGVGEVGDEYERHADQVATQVVQGKSAEGLLDRYAGSATTAGSAGTGPIQRKVTINAVRNTDKSDKKNFGKLQGGQVITDVNALWAQIKDDPRIAGQARAREILEGWVAAQPRYPNDKTRVSENRVYETEDALIRALAGEVGSQANLGVETNLAQRTESEGEVNALLGQFVQRVKAVMVANHKNTAIQDLAQTTGRYGGWAYPEGTPYGDMFENVPADLTGRIGFIADFSLSARGVFGTGKHFQMAAELSASRETHHNVNEAQPWVQEARAAKVPLSAGPSATTANVMALARTVGAPQPEINALAWALFTAWNTMPTHMTGTHRFHEVMEVAKAYGVPYDKFTYPDAPPRAAQGTGGQDAT